MAFSGAIEEIWAQYDGQHLTIYQQGGQPVPVTIPPGKSWELHVKTKANYPEVGVTGWATAVTMANGFTGGNARLHAPGMKVGDYEFAFNMGTMPSGQVNINRVKFWWNTAYTNVPPSG